MFTSFLDNPKALTWLFSTVFVAFLPILIRFIVWGFGNFPSFSIYSISDIFLFSLIIHLSVIHELRHLVREELKGWRDKFIALSVVFIFVIMIFLLCSYLNEASKNFNEVALLVMSIFFAFVSVVIGFSIFYKTCCQVPDSSNI